MSKVEIVLESSNINAFLRSEAMKSMLEERAAQVAAAAGEGYTYRTHDSGQRIIATIYAETDEARKDNLENNTLLKALK